MKEAKIQILKNRDGQVWTDPAEVYVEPAYYLFGDGQKGINPSAEFKTTKLSDLFILDDEQDLSTEINIDNIDLEI